MATHLLWEQDDESSSLSFPTIFRRQVFRQHPGVGSQWAGFDSRVSDQFWSVVQRLGHQALNLDTVVRVHADQPNSVPL